MVSDRIAVTGTTGRVGGRVAHMLAERGVPLRLLARDSSRAPQLKGAEVADVDYDEPEQIAAGLDGVQRLFFVSAPQDADTLRTHDTFVIGAEDAGVEDVVYLSHYGAERDATYIPSIAHWHTEQLLRDRFPNWTFIRNNIYADLLPTWVGPGGVIRGPGKKGRIAPVAIDDIAAVVTEVLLDPRAHDKVTYELTGPESLTFGEIAALLREVCGFTCAYKHRSASDTYDEFCDTMEQWQAEAEVSAFQAAAAGELGDVTTDVEHVLGRPATPVREVLARVCGERAGTGT